MKRGVVRVSSPFGGKDDFRAGGRRDPKGKCNGILYGNRLGVVGFITDFYTAIACCACRSGGGQRDFTTAAFGYGHSLYFGKLGCIGALINLI